MYCNRVKQHSITTTSFFGSHTSMLTTIVASRLHSAFTTFPSEWGTTFLITACSTSLCGMIATTTDFCRLSDARRPSVVKVASAFVFPSLVEEALWRGILVPPNATALRAVAILGLHVLMHPVIGESGLWPRGRDTFRDARFLVLTTIVLGGATACYMVTGGSVYAAALAHAVPLTLWRDVFGGEEQLLGGGRRS